MQLGVWREHDVVANQVESRMRNQCGQVLHELERRCHDVGGTVLVWALELQHDITSVVEFEPFVGDGGVGDLATQLKCGKAGFDHV